MTDKMYKEEYYDTLLKERRIAKVDTSNKFIKGFVAFDKNLNDYFSIGFMRMGLDYDSNKSIIDIAKRFKEIEYYKVVEELDKTIIDNHKFNTLYLGKSM